MAELADALDLGFSVPDVQVQVLSSAFLYKNLGIIISEVFCVDELIKNIV